MLIRLPWLYTRRRLFTALALDIALFALVYGFCFWLRFGSWPSPSFPLSLLLQVWLLSSYILGRYYDFEDPRRDAARKQVSRSAGAMLVSMGVYLIYNWLSDRALGHGDYRSLLLPFLFGLAASSCVLQFGLNRLLKLRFLPPSRWAWMGQFETVQALQSALAVGRLSSELEWWPLTREISKHLELALAGVVVEDPALLSQKQIQTLLMLQSEGVIILSPMGWSELVLQRFPPNLLKSSDLLRGQFTASHGSIRQRTKRLGDVVVSGLLLLVTAPLLLVAALLIWMEDRGPVFYVQTRSGLHGKPIQIYKLRSMRVDAESSGALWSKRGDPRITRIGRLLRLTRVDELPQLWSVLSGAMSLIGPRPERPEFEVDLECKIPHYRLRHLVKPGLSGWAQVNYPYGASVEDAANKLSYDLYYLRNVSLGLDLLILFKTMRLVFNARGAVPAAS